MDTSTISYRVADFLSRHLPFQAMAEQDLLDLAAQGRVRFHERHEQILSQGESHRHLVFVIQQGVVSLWDEVDGALELRDVRGPGDMLGIERFNGAPSSLHSARAATDVVIYGIPADSLEPLLDKYPPARRYVSAYGSVTLEQPAGDERQRPEDIFLHDVVKDRPRAACQAQDSIRDAARIMRTHGVEALAVVDADGQPRGILAWRDLLAWIADGHGDPDQPVAGLVVAAPTTLPPNASVADGVLTMASTGVAGALITADGTPGGQVHALVTSNDLAVVFGDQPVGLLREIRSAPTTAALRALNHRARSFALAYLSSALSVDWLAHFTSLVDAAIVKRIIEFTGQGASPALCWSFCGPAGRGESLTRVEPDLVLLAGRGVKDTAGIYQRVSDLIGECDYLPRRGQFEQPFHAAVAEEWRIRYLAWIRDPVLSEMYRARSFFDVRHIHGDTSLWADVEGALAAAVDRDFLGILANDCLSSLPPLTFFQDAVVDEMGEHSEQFQLERTVLTPLVDVARVYGMAAGRLLGGSTRDRLALGRKLLPQRDGIFREASDTFSVVLWQQGRVGIAQNTSGHELPPSLLSRHDRQLLRTGFRVILRLIELTASWEWLEKR